LWQEQKAWVLVALLARAAAMQQKCKMKVQALISMSFDGNADGKEKWFVSTFYFSAGHTRKPKQKLFY